ncbi:MAG: hypothetical protein ACFUZC_08305 [Chthoniobacteraceae bacterium]
MRLPLTSLAIILAATLPLRAQSQAPLIDLVAQNGTVTDQSQGSRTVQASPGLQAGVEPDSVISKNGNYLSVPINDKDTLFKSASSTWMVRVKFATDPGATINPGMVYLPLGRWNPVNNLRAIGIAVVTTNRSLAFQVSTDGSVGQQSCSIAGKQAYPPVGKWVTLVGTYSPGTKMTIGAYTDDGAQAFSGTQLNNIAASYFEVNTALAVNAPAEVGMAFSRARIWDRVLDDEEIQKAITGQK